MYLQNPDVVFDRCKWKAYARWEKALRFLRWCPPLREVVFSLIRLEANMRFALLT